MFLLKLTFIKYYLFRITISLKLEQKF